MIALSAVQKIRAFCFGVIGIAYFYVAQGLASHAAAGLSTADWYDLVDRLMLVFLLVVGYGALAFTFQRQRPVLEELGFKRRAGASREFGLGAAIGWGTLAVAILPTVLVGGLIVTLWAAPRQWFLLVMDAVVLLTASLGEELVFRGYALPRFMEAFGGSTGSSSGAGAATMLLAGFATVLEWSDPFAPRAAVWVAFLLSWLLSLGYLRTRALWLPWGLRFGWYASMSLLFGLPIGGISRYTPIVQSTAHGAEWLTGAEYGPEAATVTVLVLFAALLVLVKVTREYAWRYATPAIVAAGIPVDIDAISKRQHEAGMGPVVEPAAAQLVQIGSAPSASGALPDRTPGNSKPVQEAGQD